MTTKYRLLPVAGAALLTFTGIAVAAPRTNATQLPSQVIPTGAEDAAKAAPAAAAAARSIAPAAKSAEPTAAELDAQLVQMTSESSEGLRRVTLPSGGTRVDLDGRFMSVMVATPKKDGGYDVNCQTGEKAVDAAHAAEHAKETAAQVKTAAAATKPAAPVLEEK